MKKAWIIALLISHWAAAQSGGSGVFTFLDRSIFAGASALNNTAYVHPGATGAYAVQNPLLLSDSSVHQLEMSVGALGGGVNLLQSSYGFRALDRLWMASVQTVQYGTFQYADIWGHTAGEFSAGDLSLNLGTELWAWKGLELGATAKWVSGTYESYQSWAVAADFVAQYHHPALPELALVAKNAGLQLTTFGGTREPLPFNLLLAVGDKLQHAPLRWTIVVDQLHRPNLGYDDPNLVEIDPVTGEVTQGKQSFGNLALRHLSGSLEFMPTERVHLMMGYSFRRQFEMALPDRRTSGGFTLGAGLYFSKFQIHYANELRSVAGRMNTLSLGLNF